MTAKRAFAQVSKLVFNMLYRIFKLLPRRDEGVFVSRQADVPSDDFISLGTELEARGWTSVYHTRKLSKRTVFRYAIHVVKEIYLLARCKVCFLDRYDPVVSLLDFVYDPVEVDGDFLHNEFPATPIVIQIWHAFGSFKCFGYQSLDTREGHSSEIADAFDIHRNYSWILCTGESDRKAFSEAFSYPVDRIMPLGRPEFDTLLERAKQSSEKKSENTPVVLFAPTLRKSKESMHPFRELKASPDLDSIPAYLVWSFHPLDSNLPVSGSISQKLVDADIVVTDYSSIVYEAALLQKKVLFYVPDIEEYRKTPGLNADPLTLAPKIAFTSQNLLVENLSKLVNGTLDYEREDLDRFLGDTFSSCRPGVACRIVDFALARIDR